MANAWISFSAAFLDMFLMQQETQSKKCDWSYDRTVFGLLFIHKTITKWLNTKDRSFSRIIYLKVSFLAFQFLLWPALVN